MTAMANRHMEERWYQIIMTDANCLTGKSAAAFLEGIAAITTPRAAVVSDIIADAHAFGGYEDCLLPWPKVIDLARRAEHYEWAFFFLFFSHPHWDPSRRADHFVTMRYSDVAVRFAEGRHIYVYSRNRSLTDAVITQFDASAAKIALFANLDIPY